MDKLKIAVIGVGYLGKFHTEKYFKNPKCDLIGVYDTNQEVANQVSQMYHCINFTSIEKLCSQVDAVSIAAPTVKHFAIADLCLDKGVHILLEKPITDNMQEAELLNKKSKEQNLKLQIGHIERFNPAYKNAIKHFSEPLYIESIRLSPYMDKHIDVHVVLDLLIHDIDLILQLNPYEIQSINAIGMPVLSDTLDFAMLHLTFKNGLVADIKTSRLGLKKERKMRIFMKKKHMTLNFSHQYTKLYEVEHLKKTKSIAKSQIILGNDDGEQEDLIYNEIDSFVTSVLENKPVAVSADEAIRALDISLQCIDTILHKSQTKN